MGLALVWKPAGILSQECLFHFKKTFLNIHKKSGKSQIGHTGTLDPFADGWLLVGWEEGSKLLAPLMGMQKTYIVQMKFAQTSDTLDGTGKLQDAPSQLLAQLSSSAAKWSIDSSILENFLKSKIGRGTQVPPKYSALHVDGERAYDLARKGIEFELKARDFEIFEAKHIFFDVENLLWTFEVTVSSGTYIRSFARDWGLELSEFPGLLSGLTRTAIGPFPSNQSPATLRESSKDKLNYHSLCLKDLAQIFDFQTLSDAQALPLQQNGRLVISLQSGSKPMILLNLKEEALAWITMGQREIGRVFQKDPLAF